MVNQESIEDQQLNSQGGAIVDDPYERTPSSFDRSVEPALMSNTPELKVPAVWNATLGNGMTVKGIVYSELPLVNFAIELGNGMLSDTPAKAWLLDTSIVHIATPPHWHGIMSADAARAGKDIWCEKPMTRTIGEGKRVKEAVKQNGSIFRLNTWFRFTDTFYLSLIHISGWFPACRFCAVRGLP